MIIDHLNQNQVIVLQRLIRSILSKKEKEIVRALEHEHYPLPLSELKKTTSIPYSTLKRLVLKLENHGIIFASRGAIKIITLNPVLRRNK